MSWSDWFLPSTSQTSQEQAENYARQQAEYQAALERRMQEGTLPSDYAPAAGGELESQDGAAWQGAKEGAIEGAGNVVNFATSTLPNAINTTLGATVGVLFRSIPFTVWLLAGVALFVYMGGFAMLRGRLSKV